METCENMCVLHGFEAWELPDGHRWRTWDFMWELWDIHLELWHVPGLSHGLAGCQAGLAGSPKAEALLPGDALTSLPELRRGRNFQKNDSNQQLAGLTIALRHSTPDFNDI